MILFIAEKPDLGKSIAAAIPGKKEYDTHKGIITTSFEGEPATIVWCYGHLLTLWDPEDYDPNLKEWKMETIPFYFPDWKHKAQPDKADRVKQIGALLQHADTVVNAGDIDEEGQLLVDELLSFHNYNGKVLRLNTNDTSEVAMRKALKSMVPNELRSRDGVSAFGRQLCDKVFGYNLTRYYSLINGGKKTLPTGRVKMPTLGLVVQRDRLIENHKKILYYTINASVAVAAGKPVDVPCRYVPCADNPHLTNGKFLDKEYVQGLKSKIEGASLPDIAITREIKKSAPPLPFNQTKLYEYCARKWDLQPTEVAKITQNLREKHKAITYNRSDCQYLGEATFDEAPATLPTICANLQIDSTQFDTTIKSKCFNDANISAHTAIIPTNKKQDLSTFTSNERKVYEAIAKFYLIQFMPPLKSEVTKLATPAADGGSLQSTSSKVLEQGYRVLLDDQDEETDDDENQQAAASALSTIPVGNYNGSVKNASISEQETKPPARYTQASLLSDMSSIAKYVQHPTVKKLLLQKDQGKKGESGSIGTPATRHAIIGELIKAGYLYEEKKGKRTNLISTELGREFYDVLPDSVRKVDVSAKWWYEQQKIKEGEMTPEEMARDVLRTVQAIINSKAGRMENADRYSTGVVGGTPLGKCPKCGGDVYETAKGYKCMGQDCKFYISKEDKFFANVLRKPVAPAAISIMLKSKHLKVKNITSKSGKTYDAEVLVDFSGDFPQYKFASDDEVDAIGKCPLCGGRVIEKNRGFFCTTQECSFSIWKENKFLQSLGKKGFTTAMVKNLLTKHQTPLKGCVSQKTQKKYDAVLCVAFDTDGKAKYSLDFPKKSK